MTSKGFGPQGIRSLIDQLTAELTPEQRAQLLGENSALDDLWRRPQPQLHPIPDTVRGYVIRVDLQRTKPPVWRRIEVAGDILLPRLHDVLQGAMGWTDSHLHRFRTSNDRNPPEFLTQFDLDEGDEGMLEDDVRLDQVVTSVGDRLWYDYDFGDGWNHVLRVEKVLDAPPDTPRCLAGKLACPPEDCGGTWGYEQLADWVRSDYDDTLRPEVFDSAADGREWLPIGWHPDAFDIEQANEQIMAMAGDPVPVVAELAELLELARDRGSRGLRDVLANPSSFGGVDVTDEDAARLTEPFRVLLDVLGDGAALTPAGYLKPAMVEQIARGAGIADWWIGKINREDLTWPVSQLHSAARSLGLVSVRKGRIAPTQAVKRHADDPQALLAHIIQRLPLGKPPAERHAGWVALTIAGSEVPTELWEPYISEVMYGLGWRDGRDNFGMPPAYSPTLDVLEILGGSPRHGGRLREVDPAVAAVARAATRASTKDAG